MKNKEIVSGVVGASFFAIGYLGLSVAIVPSLVLGAGAYIASELLINDSKKKINEVFEDSLTKKIENARKFNLGR